jgi:acyl carrier protein
MAESTAPVSRDEFSLLPPYVAPRTATEEKLAEIWARRLGVDRIGITDLYEDLGGSSLAAAAIAVEIEKTFGVEIKMDTLIQAPTVEELASKIDEFVGDTRGG